VIGGAGDKSEGAERNRLLSQFAKASTGVFFANALSLPLVFLLHVYAARLVGKATYGEFSIAMTCANLLVIPLCFGLHTGTVRFLPAYAASGDAAKQAGYLKFSRWLTLAISILVSTLGALLLTLWNWPISDSLRRTLLSLAVQIPCLTLFTLYCSFLQSQRKVVSQAVLRGVVRPLLILGGLFCLSSLLESLPSAGVLVSVETLVLCVVLVWAGITTRNLLRRVALRG